MNVLRFDSDRAWTDGVCSLWRDRLHTQPGLKMCLPTGLTPLPVYAAMIRSVAAGHASFADATIFALDEFGGIADDDPGRTRHTLQRELIGRIDLPASSFRFVATDEADVERQCEQYDAAMGDGFDLVLLGIGTNGHLGMNEPGSPETSRTRRVDLHESTIQASARYFSHRNLPRWGVTVGLHAILSAREVWVLATGTAKAAIVRQTIDGPIGIDNPASLLRRHPNCSLFVDPDAAARLWRLNLKAAEAEETETTEQDQQEQQEKGQK
jgi:glucosamine-6-phosphate deaminase